MKYRTDFRKTVKTGMDPRPNYVFPHFVMKLSPSFICYKQLLHFIYLKQTL